MTAEEFVAAVSEDVFRAGIRGVLGELQDPSGRRPSPTALALAEWYSQLSGSDRARVGQVVASAAHAALFGLLVVLDGARRIAPAGGRFELAYIGPEGTRVILNPPDAREDLHDLFQTQVWDAVFGEDGV